MLVVLDEDAADAALDRLRGMLRVLHTGSPRLVVGEPTAAPSRSAVRDIEGVVAVTDGELPQSLLDRLRPEEQLFATAWASRMAERTKERRGEGLAWDAPGFVPPDPPKHEP